MQPLNLPPYPFRIVQKEQKTLIFDEIRKKFIQLTPEEWVRQHFIQFLIGRQYPKSSISIEKKVVGQQQLIRRTDLVAFDRSLSPFLLVECKAPQVKITQDTFEQISQYNHFIKAPFMVVTNGVDHFILSVNHQDRTYSFLEDLPPFAK